MANQKEKDNIKLNTSKNILKRLFQVSMSVIIIAFLLFVSVGKINWIYGWLYILTSLLIIIINAFILPPELISERGRKKENKENWDKIISLIIMIPLFTIYIVSGLDIRFKWSGEFALWIHITSLIFFILGNAFVSWAMISNIYFSTAVRIQYDRGQKVSDNGPYRYLRHPGYLGMIIFYLATPLILGSFWGLIPSSLTVILFIIRTEFEDNTLKNKLEGYKEYVKRVKYRLIPGIW
jgi:protein-S-isoprenylcysteine O-methyltransferase Ste14